MNTIRNGTFEKNTQKNKLKSAHIFIANHNPKFAKKNSPNSRNGNKGSCNKFRKFGVSFLEMKQRLLIHFSPFLFIKLFFGT